MSQLFDDGAPTGAAVHAVAADAPLAARMRPATAEQLVGQSHLVAPGSALSEALHGRALHSMILYGPPGTGKTTIARLVASASDAAFDEESAVAAGRAEVRAVIERARERQATSGRRTIFFLDEIHRFNKAQQDALLPAVEDGTLTLIGATTENPYFEVNSALLSRSRLYVLEPLSDADIRLLLEQALSEDRGLGGSVTAGDEVLDFISARAGGDARTALSALETAAAVANGETITIEAAEDAMQRKSLAYDKQGDVHYNYASAFIKSMRGSDPDAAVYYLAVMLDGGEDPRFIARRIVIFASEDIGNADPQALQVAVAAAQAVEHVGLPEARINLSQAATYMALAPKSNAAYKAIQAAAAHVAQHGAKPPPVYLRDSHVPKSGEAEAGDAYEYPHDLRAGVSSQRLLPRELEDEVFYSPVERGQERELAERLEKIRRIRKQQD